MCAGGSTGAHVGLVDLVRKGYFDIEKYILSVLNGGLPAIIFEDQLIA
jgi:hypothetical protein